MADPECISGGGKIAVIPDRSNEVEQGNVLLFHNLCDELLTEILVRLPCREAVGFQVVCKRWYSLISSPYFTHLRHQRDVEFSIVLEFVDDYNQSHFEIISLLSREPAPRPLNLSFLPRPHAHQVRLESSFSDLILLCSSFTNYYVTNPLTNQWIALPPLPALPHSNSWAVGFMCNNSHRYKFIVVRILREPSRAAVPCSKFKFQVFSSEWREWRILDVSSSVSFKQYANMTSLFAYRGMLHWLTKECIVAYDPFNTPQTFSRIIHLPTKPPHFSSIKTSCFGVCRGRLRLLHIAAGEALEVWDLEDYDSKLWNLVHKLYFKNITYNGLPLICDVEWGFGELSPHPQNGDVVYLGIDNAAILVNIKTGIVEGYYPSPYRKPSCSWMKAFQLTHQCWPTQLSSLLH